MFRTAMVNGNMNGALVAGKIVSFTEGEGIKTITMSYKEYDRELKKEVEKEITFTGVDNGEVLRSGFAMVALITGSPNGYMASEYRVGNGEMDVTLVTKRNGDDMNINISQRTVLFGICANTQDHMTKTGKKTVTTAIPIATGNKDENGNEISEWKNITFWGAFKEGDRDLAKGAQMLKPVITTNKDGEQVQRKQRAVIICKKNKPFVSENGKTYVSYTASAFEVFEPFTAGNSTNSYGQATPMPSTVNIPDTTNPVSNEVTPTAENNYGYNPNDFVTVPDDYDELPFN